MARSFNLQHFQKQPSVSIHCNSDVLSMLEPGSDLTLSISTLAGARFMCQTPFIGIHSNTYLLSEISQVPEHNLESFFQKGFNAHIRAISAKGEGAFIHFRTQILYIIREPIALAVFSIPETVQMTQLRKEQRYELNLLGIAIMDNHHMDCEIRDLSKSGCRLLTPCLGKTYKIGDQISIETYRNFPQDTVVSTLEGRVCNLQHSMHHANYGVEFTAGGKKNANRLLQRLNMHENNLHENNSHKNNSGASFSDTSLNT
jgi:c-di-GMP-binding flagellar brake protein YcgR